MFCDKIAQKKHGQKLSKYPPPNRPSLLFSDPRFTHVRHVFVNRLMASPPHRSSKISAPPLPPTTRAVLRVVPHPRVFTNIMIATCSFLSRQRAGGAHSVAQKNHHEPTHPRMYIAVAASMSVSKSDQETESVLALCHTSGEVRLGGDVYCPSRAPPPNELSMSF